MTMTIHVRHQGQSIDLTAQQLGLSEAALRQAATPEADRTLKDALARFFTDLRAERPELALRTTVLLGFPGETEDDVERVARSLRLTEAP